MNSPDGQKLVLPKGRTIPINGDVVRTARISRKLSHIDLSDLTELSADRLIEIEKGGQKVYQTSFLAIANALGYEKDWRPLIQGEANSAVASQPGTTSDITQSIPKLTLTISDESTIKESMSPEAIATVLITLFDLKHGVTITGIRKGSVIVELELSEEDLLRLVAAFSEAKLDIIKVESIHLPATTGALAAGLLQIIEPDKETGEVLSEPVTPEMTLTRTPTKPVAFSVEEHRKLRDFDLDPNFLIFLLFISLFTIMFSGSCLYFIEFYAKKEYRPILHTFSTFSGIMIIVMSISTRRFLRLIKR